MRGLTRRVGSPCLGHLVALGLTTLLTTLGLSGCGLGCAAFPPGPQDRPPAREPEPAEAPSPAQAAGEPTPSPRWPTLSADAKRARAEALRTLLGRRSTLFEAPGGGPLPDLGTAPVAKADAPPKGPDDTSVDGDPHDAAFDALPGSSGMGGGDVPSSASVVPAHSLGQFVPIEQPRGEAVLRRFYEALHRLEGGLDPDGKVRVLLYGASHTDADIYPDYLRTYLQERFGDGGHGFVQVAQPWKWYRHVDMGVKSSRGWLTEHAQRQNGRKDGYFGLMGCSVTARSKKEWSQIFPRNDTMGTHYELYFLTQPGGGKFQVVIDGKPQAIVDTQADTFGPGYHALTLARGSHVVELRAVDRREVRLFGMTVELDQTGVVVDTLGIGGTRAANHLRTDETIWMDNVRRRAPDLYVLAYGTNESLDDDQPIDAYEADLRTTLERFAKAAPEASCLLVGPGDVPLATPHGFVPRPRLADIIDVQRSVAADLGCGFWDTFSFMGGELSMLSWVASDPPLARKDHVHLTREGYVRMGMALTDALMAGYETDAPG